MSTRLLLWQKIAIKCFTFSHQHWNYTTSDPDECAQWTHDSWWYICILYMYIYIIYKYNYIYIIYLYIYIYIYIYLISKANTILIRCKKTLAQIKENSSWNNSNISITHNYYTYHISLILTETKCIKNILWNERKKSPSYICFSV